MSKTAPSKGCMKVHYSVTMGKRREAAEGVGISSKLLRCASSLEKEVHEFYNPSQPRKEHKVVDANGRRSNACINTASEERAIKGGESARGGVGLRKKATLRKSMEKRSSAQRSPEDPTKRVKT